MLRQIESARNIERKDGAWCRERETESEPLSAGRPHHSFELEEQCHLGSLLSEHVERSVGSPFSPVNGASLPHQQ